MEELLLFSLRFQIRAVESPDLRRVSGTKLNNSIDFSLCTYHSAEINGLGDFIVFNTVYVVIIQCEKSVTDPEASRSLTGFQAQMKTSDS